MGLNRHSFRPAGFCFVECVHASLPPKISLATRALNTASRLRRFYQRQHAVDAVCFCNGATLDDMEIRCELDPGFQKGREFGYGLSGGQSIDDLRLKPHSERPREQFVPWRNRAECVLAALGARSPPLRLHNRTGTSAPSSSWDQLRVALLKS